MCIDPSSVTDIMSTVSLIECAAPVSCLRSCGSSNKTLLENRRRLQCTSPDKLTRMSPSVPLKAKVPYIQGISLSPACVGSQSLGYINRVASATTGCFNQVGSKVPACVDKEEGPSPACINQVKWPYECHNDDFNESVSASSEEFSDEDLTEICGSQEVAKMLSHNPHEDLLIVGSKPKLHSMFEIPVPVIKPSTETQSSTQIEEEEDNSDPEFSRDCHSPGNPPPSPISFEQSVEGFVIGGKRLMCPVKNNLGLTGTARDFKPGFVKYPLFHCKKCVDKVMDEEQSQAALQRRQGEFLRSRASPYKYDRSMLLMSRLSHRSRPDSQPSLVDCEHDARSFLEIYTEKKRQKEEKELERKRIEAEIKDKKTPEPTEAEREAAKETSGEQRHSFDLKMFSKQDNSSTDASSSYYNGSINKASLTLLKHQTKRRFAQALRDTSGSRVLSVSYPYSGSSRMQMWDVSDLSSVQTVQEPDTSCDSQSKSSMRALASDTMSSVVDKCQVRPCWSDIWPFHENQDTTEPSSDFGRRKMSRPKTTMGSCGGVGLGKFRITPFCALPPGKYARKHGIERSTSALSTMTSYHVISHAELNEETEATKKGTVQSVPEVDVAEEKNDTLSTTVIIPPKEKTCSQWISFNTDHEPVLNNAPITNEGCDNFLKRLQRTQLYDSHTPLPTGQQFCYEPVIDKRYNRWKRRRRKKKDVESRRPTFTIESDSSDDENEREVERIIGRMYEEIHGTAPATPNGTSDTPRMRNRRRRRDLSSKSDTIKITDDTLGCLELHYDASSEWVASDKSDDELNLEIHKSGRPSQIPKQRTSSARCRLTSERTTDSPEYLQDDFVHRSESTGRIESSSTSEQTSTPEDFLQIISPDPLPEEFQQIISVQCERRPTDSAPRQTGDKSELLGDRDLESRESAEIDEELRGCFSVDDSTLENRLDSPCTHEYILNKDCLPEIPKLTCPDRSHRQRKTEMTERVTKTPEPVSKTGSDKSFKLLERRNSVSSNAKEKSRLQQRTPLRLPTSSLKDLKFTKTSRKPGQSIKPKSPEDDQKSISRLGASSWSELGYNPKQPKRIGLVSVTETNMKFSPTPFKGSLRPVRRETVKYPVKTELKDFATLKKKALSLPKLTKTVKGQTIPRLQRRNSNLYIEKKSKQKAKIPENKEERPKTIPQPKHEEQRNANNVNLDPRAKFMFRDYYLRSLYNSKSRLNSQVNTKSRVIPAHQTITVDRIDLGNREPAKKEPSDKEKGLSNLSFTRSFTFSMFDLPSVYKLYNKRIERQSR